MSKFWRGILSTDGEISSKRLITLVVSAHFILSAFIILGLIAGMVFYMPKGTVDQGLIGLFKDILYYDNTIILGGLGVIGLDNLGKAWVEHSKKGSRDVIPGDDIVYPEKLKD
jgi:hypothetical protein